MLGLIQGLTEFLPVSSSGHVALGGWLLGQQELPLITVVVVHGGTLLATLVVVRKEILEGARHLTHSATSPSGFFDSTIGWTLAGTVIASIPTAVVGIVLRDAVEDWSRSPFLVGSALCVTAAVLLTTLRRSGHLTRLGPLGYFLVGCAQACAVFPGISRSGATIAAGLLMGLSPHAAFRFSFFLSLPAVAGALVLSLAEPEARQLVGVSSLVAGGVAMVVGLLALKALEGVVGRGKLWLFALYLLPLGLGLMAWQTTT